MKQTLIAACSGMLLTSNSKKPYWFRTCDIDTDIFEEGAYVVSHPAGSRIAFFGREEETVKYGFFGITNHGVETWLLDGINEKGLTGGLLFLNEGIGADTPEYGREGYVGMELVTKLLSVCADVDEVIALAQTIQVCNIPFAGQSVPATMHYFFADTKGNEVILEAADAAKPGILTVYDKKETFGILTNSPTYPQQVRNLKWYLAAAPEFNCGMEEERAGRLVIGGKEIKGDKEAAHFLRSDTFPASYCSYDRFIRLSVLKGLNRDGSGFSDDEMLALGSNLMSSVFEPMTDGVYHYRGFDETDCPVGRKNSYTQYLVMYDMTERKLYLRPYKMTSFTEYHLKNCNKESREKYHIICDGPAGILKGN